MSSSSLLPLISSFTSLPSTNFNRTIKTQTNQAQGFRVSCNQTPDDHNDKKLILPQAQKLVIPNVDRRNLLVGLGGLYTATNLTSMPSALADPIKTPDITSICKEAGAGVNNKEKAIRSLKCCPPSLGKTIKDFVFPTDKKVRMRWPAHAGTKEQVDKYRAAIQAMRDLPDDHPHSFVSQAKIHCAYCNGGYTQVESGIGNGDKDIQIHNSWLFFPFHRWYLYFYERILGKLINDPDFALPFWKWDEPAGMPIPEMFVPETIAGKPNPLYDVYRNADHIKDRIVDLDYGGTDRGLPNEKQIESNLCTVYRELVRNGADTLSFFGGKYAAGNDPVLIGDKSIGSVERGSHTAVHRWVGDSKNPNDEDMGNFYSAGYDPAFYIHHSNVDRMWKLWKDLRLSGHVDPTETDWLDASYVFYDENEDLVRVYNRDSVSLNKLKYNYIENSKEMFPWRNSRPAKRNKNLQVTTNSDVKKVDQINFPVPLNKIFKVRVKRPAVSRSVEEKEKANEVLVIKRIRYDSGRFVKFDVFVNDKLKDDVVTTTCDPEYAGGFAQIPHGRMKNMFMLSSARFGLTELLEDTNTDDDEYATVTLVPRTGCGDLTVGKIEIILVPVAAV
ncbi:hypothetical protein E3N88_34239 [Mikania micrantha]|uniref:Tyrosinase copper-binding domain-containing protein n=1 Tax=Mikania micrantha TaxID=192012 RepID=A0A5N6LXJ2_9ASTR|nr:hypothetical protein E3N88_34239 [Mikania micrantha]